MNSQELVDTCLFGCENGMCLSPAGEGVHDVGFDDFVNATNMIRLKNSDDIDILEGESLQCNQEYKVIIVLENRGNFTENVTYDGSVGDIDFSHTKTNNLDPEERTSQKTRTVNFTLAEGSYQIIIDAIIEGFDDDNSADNRVMRDVFVSCPNG